jgi:hypothetical protein
VKVILNHHFIIIFSHAITIQDSNTNFNYITCKWVSQIFNYVIYVLETIQNIICKWIPTSGGYGGNKNVPTPTTPDGWKNHPLRYPSGEKIPHTHTLIGFLPAGKRVVGTHWHPWSRQWWFHQSQRFVGASGCVYVSIWVYTVWKISRPLVGFGVLIDN